MCFSPSLWRGLLRLDFYRPDFRLRACAPPIQTIVAVIGFPRKVGWAPDRGRDGKVGKETLSGKG
jgi:hypothetical protein